jgi:hypothetical protein
MPTDVEVVEAASKAAEGLVLDRIRSSDIDDLDVTVTFEDGVLEVDVYVHAPAATVDVDQVVDEAARAAQAAVDDLFAAEQ